MSKRVSRTALIWTGRERFMQMRESELRRTPLPKLSEKGYEQRSEREFDRCTEEQMSLKDPFHDL